MSLIKYCALGGLGEVGKNMSILEVDDKIFILDAGLKFPSVKLYGVDTVIPDFTYLRENNKRIVGVFLSHGHLEHFGAICELLKLINVPIYATHFTKALVEAELTEAGMNVSDYSLYEMNEREILKFGKASVTIFRTTHTIPDSCGIAIYTPDGAIVYAPDFSFNSVNDPIYRTSYGKLSEIASQGVLLLCSDSLGCMDIDRVTSDYVFNHTVSDVLTTSSRVIFSMYATDLNRIQRVIDLCAENNRRIALLGRKVQRTINVAIKQGFLKIPEENLVNLKYLNNDNRNEEEDLVVIIAGSRHEPYYMLSRMSNDQDRLIAINEKDTIVIVSPPVIGTEKVAAKTVDAIHRLNARVINIPKTMLVGSHPDGEDLKMIYQFLNPKYIIPISGEYRHQYTQRKIALESGYEKDDIIMLDNGEQITFIDGELQNARDKISTGDVLVDGSLVGDINEVVVRDREYLSTGGTIIVVVYVDKAKMELVSIPKIVSRGFLSAPLDEEIGEKLSDIALNIALDFFENKNSVDFNDMKNELRDYLSEYVEGKAHLSPIIIPIIIDVNEEESYERIEQDFK